MTFLKLLTRLRWLILAAAILKWMSFYAWVLSDRFGLEYSIAVWDSIISNVLAFTACALLIRIVVHYIPEAGKYWFALALGFFLSLLCVWLTQEALLQVGAGTEGYQEFINRASPIRWSIDFLMITGVSVGAVLYSQLQDQRGATEREAATAVMVREAELQKLQLQLQPHFLFNCLNSINALILVRAEEARKMVQQLSDFLRITLKRADEHWITFEEEWQYLQLYLEIEKVRFGHRLDVETRFEDGTLACKIPTLLLQPLVENAIKFGLYGTTGKVTIRLDANLKGPLLEIRVTNPFDTDTQPSKGNGFGLNGLRRRLYLLFARNDLLETQISDNVFSVVLRIPDRNDQSNPY
jgi:two-component system, LytTR family, sensor kinase